MIIGQIYILTSKLTEKCYIGSTTYKYLSQRFNTHRVDYKSGTKDYKGLFGYDKEGNFIEPEIKLLEEVKCETKDELHIREQEWIDTFEDLCINKKRAYATPEQKLESFNASVKKYHCSEKGKLSMKKANLRYSIQRLQVEITDETNPIIQQKEDIDHELAKYLTLCYESIDSDHKDMYCEIIDRQSALARIEKKHNKKKETLQRYLIELSELCPEDPLLN